MGLEDIVTVNITAQTSSPTRPGFGTPLIAAYHTRWTTDLVREYASTTEMTDDGFLVTDPAYLCAQAVFSQSPRPKKIKVGRRTRAFTQTIDLTPTITTEGYVYTIKIGADTLTYTVLAAATVATICAALTTAINALAGGALHTAVDGTTKVTVTTATAGNLLDYADWTNGLTFKDATADPGIAADIVDIVAEDDDWYGLLLDSNSEAEVAVAALSIEARIKLFGYTTSDTETYDAGDTDDVFSTLKTSNYARTFGILSSKRLLSWSAAAWMGNRFPFDPGSDTWAFKTLRGVVTDVLSSGKVTAVLNKRGNVYTAVAGVSVTQFGKTASAEYIDVTRFIDWLRSEIQIRLFALLINNQKIPYTDLGVDMVKAVIKAVLSDGIRAGGLASDPAPEVTAPAVKDVDPVTKAGRILPDVKFTATLAGAIHQLEIDGTLSV